MIDGFDLHSQFALHATALGCRQFLERSIVAGGYFLSGFSPRMINTVSAL